DCDPQAGTVELPPPAALATSPVEGDSTCALCDWLATLSRTPPSPLDLAWRADTKPVILSLIAEHAVSAPRLVQRSRGPPRAV
ncbi:MAG: hypothetical protein WD045_11250, partial [Pirellulaceae bacterium]